MAALSLPTNPSLERMRRDARRLQRAARAGEVEARRLVAAHHPERPDPATLALHAAQLTVARSYGFPSWPRLVAYFDVVADLGRPAGVLPSRAESPGLTAAGLTAAGSTAAGSTAAEVSPADVFCRDACLDYTDDAPTFSARADDLRRRQPDLTAEHIWAASAAADVDAVRAHLAGDPARADRVGGPYRWTPLCYLTYSRAVASRDDVLATATALLDAGADPNAGYLWGGLPIPFTVLTGVFGEGEQGGGRCPRHPYADALARLLLARGADPNDGQTLYNRMFGRDDSHLELLLAHGLGRGDGGPWQRRLGPDALATPAEMLAGQLDWAVTHGFTGRVKLLLAHGVDPAAPRRDGRRAIDVAASLGHREIFDALVAAGAVPEPLSGGEALIAALLAGDEAGVAARVAYVAGVRRAVPGLVARAYSAGRLGDALPLLLAHGFDVNAKDNGATALHEAAWQDDVAAIRTLLAAGADRSILDDRFTATPLGWAEHGHHQAARAALIQV